MTSCEQLEKTLLLLETLETAGQIDVLRQAAIDTHGVFKTPRLGGKSYDKIARIRAFGVYSQGSNMNEAISCWCQAARRKILVYEQLERAERILRDEGPISDTDARMACNFILSNSTCAGIRLIASSFLTALDKAKAA